LGQEFVPIIHKIVEVGERLKLRRADEVQATGTIVENRNPVAEIAAEL
jgi:hypothetical protein